MIVNNKDYRLLPNEDFDSLQKDIDNLKKTIANSYRGRTRIINGNIVKYINYYNALRKKTDFKNSYVKCFKNHCCYCGNSKTTILRISDFEIDHINASKKQINRDRFDNLCPSCRICNRLKSDIVQSSAFADKINPTLNISNLFYRDAMLHVRIREELINDQEVVSFYNTLRLDNEVRRIDYLLLCLNSLKDNAIKQEVKSLSKDIYDSLINKRKDINDI